MPLPSPPQKKSILGSEKILEIIKNWQLKTPAAHRRKTIRLYVLDGFVATFAKSNI